jgi:adenosylmethionine-8-amino-7-oxononanoate aminotransferase
MVPQPDGWLPRVAQITADAGALLICDEVATGFGRTGRMFAVEHEQVRPDFLCLAKGLTAGYLPLAATLTTDAVYDAFLGEPHELRTFFHGHTYTGNPLACAAALANLDLMEQRNTVAESARKGELLGAALERRVAPHRNVGAIRRRGMMIGIELVADRSTNAPLDPQLRSGWRVCRVAQDLGLRIRPLGDVIVLMPPLATPDDLLLRMVEITSDALARVPFPESIA